jgi:hypothetical protein
MIIEHRFEALFFEVTMPRASGNCNVFIHNSHEDKQLRIHQRQIYRRSRTVFVDKTELAQATAELARVWLAFYGRCWAV